MRGSCCWRGRDVEGVVHTHMKSWEGDPNLNNNFLLAPLSCFFCIIVAVFCFLFCFVFFFPFFKINGTREIDDNEAPNALSPNKIIIKNARVLAAILSWSERRKTSAVDQNRRSRRQWHRRLEPIAV